ncbi:MAG: caspase family protein [Acidobacteriota bacterium]
MVRKFFFTFLILVLSFSQISKSDTAEAINHPNQAVQSSTRRALLVGINLYQPGVGLNQCKPDGEFSEPTAVKPQKSKVAITKSQRVPAVKNSSGQAKGGAVSGTPGRSAFGNLCGPAKDIEEMETVLKSKFGFTEITVLKDQEATRENILQTFQKHLIDDTKPGDICFFFYSGHGSKVKNSASIEDDKYDESIVPADSFKGARDIRDKELADLYNRAIDKGVVLTVISDSCHSGSNARGAGYPIAERVRALPFDENDVKDGKRPEKSAEERGALVIAAAQDYQEAKERMRNGIWRGNLAYSLVNVLKSPTVSPNESAEKIYQRVVAFMKGDGVNEQPVISGEARRLKRALFGWDAASTDLPTVAVISKDGNLVTLQGGLAMGLNTDCELKKQTATKEPPVRLKITKLNGIDSCDALVIEGNAKNITKGDIFVLDRWVTRDHAILTVWIPQAVDFRDIEKQTAEINKLKSSPKIEWLDDPTEISKSPANLPLAIIFYDNGWKLKLAETVENLGANIVASDVIAKLSEVKKIKLFIHLPPVKEIAQNLQIGKGTRREAIAVSNSPDNAQYFLVGRMIESSLEYAWVRPGSRLATSTSANDPLPSRSDWFRLEGTGETWNQTIESLTDRVVTLGKIRGWLQLDAPNEGRNFPYKLALRNTDTGELVTGNCRKNGEPVPCEVKEGQKFDLVLVADKGQLKPDIKPQRVYVFTIDSEGTGYLLFNRFGNVENKIPKNPSNPQPVELLGTPGMIKYVPPFGLDTYILITTDDEVGLSDPKVLEFTGAIQRKGGQGMFESLIDDLRTGTRGPVAEVPLNWSIERLFIRSVAKNN